LNTKKLKPEFVFHFGYDDKDAFVNTFLVAVQPPFDSPCRLPVMLDVDCVMAHRSSLADQDLDLGSIGDVYPSAGFNYKQQ